MRLHAKGLLFRVLLASPLAFWAAAVLWFANDGTAGDPRLETQAVTPFGADTSGAPVVVAARVVCSFANEDAAAASIKEFDGVASVIAGDESFWLFGDSWLTRKRGGLLFANSTVARSTDSDARDCVSLDFKDSDGIAEPLLEIAEGESTVWPDGALSLDPNYVDFYFASVKRTSSSSWHVETIGLGRFDTESMDARRVEERLWDAESGFGDSIRGARSPLVIDGEVYVFLHTTDNRHILARVPATSIAKASAYSYWTGSAWSTSPGEAKSLWPEPPGNLPSHNGLSVRRNDFLGKWLAVYDHDLNTISVRVSDSLTGPWSGEVQWLDCKTLFPTAVGPPCYYAEQHAELSRDDGRTIYVTVSSAPPYDVYLLEMTLGAAVHEWRDSDGAVVLSPASPGAAYVDEGFRFYAADREASGLSPIYLWTSSSGERVYAADQPSASFSRGDVAFYASTDSHVPGSIVPYVAVYRWDAGTEHLYSTAATGLESQGYVRGEIAFYAVCGDDDLEGVGDCLE